MMGIVFFQVSKLAIQPLIIFYCHGCIMFMVVLYSSSSPFWCPPCPLFLCCGRRSTSFKEELQHCIGENEAQLTILVTLFQMRSSFLTHSSFFFPIMVVFYPWSFCFYVYLLFVIILCSWSFHVVL
jgi:hypothetical protein